MDRLLPAACLLLAGAPAAATLHQVTPREFARWSANGSSYGYTCAVATPDGAVFRREMNGAVVGRLPRGNEFVLSDAAYDRNRRIWYRVDFIYQSRLRGWVRAADVACHADSFH
ncbi:hypothetical protein GCM10023232_08850 [Sphingosinicella ginsenosidimutans]